MSDLFQASSVKQVANQTRMISPVYNQDFQATSQVYYPPCPQQPSKYLHVQEQRGLNQQYYENQVQLEQQFQQRRQHPQRFPHLLFPASQWNVQQSTPGKRLKDSSHA